MVSPCRIVTSPKGRLSMMRHFSFLFITAMGLSIEQMEKKLFENIHQSIEYI
jgi:hypothetical protein